LVRRSAHRRPDVGPAGAVAAGVPLLLLGLLPVRLPGHRRAAAPAPSRIPHPRDPGDDGAEPADAKADARRSARRVLPPQAAALDLPEHAHAAREAAARVSAPRRRITTR